MALPPDEGPGDPSMDDILASIRRILNEDEAPPAPPRHGDDDLLLLDRSMMLPENDPPSSTPTPDVPVAAPAGPAADTGAGTPAGTPALGELVRRVSADRAGPAGRGVTVEELVREELRPLLRAWLDAHLPPLVERLARAEIERLVNRAAAEG